MNHVIILSGVSGSGKSTYARTRLGSADVVSADSYFYSIGGGKYAFDASKLSEAHGACFRRFIQLLQHTDENTIVVDNTNTTTEEIAPYVLGAQAFGATCEIVTLRGEYSNEHGVPAGTIVAQRTRIENRKLPPWWKSSEVWPAYPPHAWKRTNMTTPTTK